MASAAIQSKALGVHDGIGEHGAFALRVPADHVSADSARVVCAPSIRLSKPRGDASLNDEARIEAAKESKAKQQLELMRKVSPNDLRRTYASWLKQRGVDSMIVAKLLGHTTSRMVELVYGISTTRRCSSTSQRRRGGAGGRRKRRRLPVANG